MIPAEVPAPILGDEPKLAENLNLVYNDEGDKPQSIAGNLRPFSVGGYAEFTPATREIRLIQNNGKSQLELAKAKVEMKPGSFHTIIVQKANGQYALSSIDDTPPPPKNADGSTAPPPSKRIIFYNFLPGDTVNISSKDAGFLKTVSFGSPQMAAGLPGKIFSVQMPLKTKKREFTSDIEVDLQTNDSLSFVIVQNLYGKTAAFVIPNGKVE